ncbi:zinc finger protein 433-like [Neocloeon triangulifer]|uniref:zinc finger protein 433-like n=1 Tax=Neocloeon triangulifer TaxID=2078957 RepID=UPI00286F216A|nr:zinc finger protein 433-like [Neocloeon triangulifer]
MNRLGCDPPSAGRIRAAGNRFNMGANLSPSGVSMIDPVKTSSRVHCKDDDDYTVQLLDHIFQTTYGQGSLSCSSTSPESSPAKKNQLEGRVRCAACRKIYLAEEKSELEKHIADSKCVNCHRTFACRTRLKQHHTKGCKLVTTTSHASQLVCKRCSTRCYKESDMIDHRRYKTCVYCGGSFNCATLVKRHEAQCKQKRQTLSDLECIVCTKKMGSVLDLNAHFENLDCSCGLKFACRGVLQFHKDTSGICGGEGDNNNDEEKTSEKQDRMRCTACETSFDSPKDLSCHQAEKECLRSSQPSTLTSPSKSLQEESEESEAMECDTDSEEECSDCPYCKLPISSFTEWHKHLGIKHICEWCCSTLKCSGALEQHQKTCFSAVVDLRCQHCNFALGSGVRRMLHCEPRSCQRCGKKLRCETLKREHVCALPIDDPRVPSPDLPPGAVVNPYIPEIIDVPVEMEEREEPELVEITDCAVSTDDDDVVILHDLKDRTCL